MIAVGEHRTLKRLGGPFDYKLTAVETEHELIIVFLDLLKGWDPECVAGYEVHSASWGYLMERAHYGHGTSAEGVGQQRILTRYSNRLEHPGRPRASDAPRSEQARRCQVGPMGLYSVQHTQLHRATRLAHMEDPQVGQQDATQFVRARRSSRLADHVSSFQIAEPCRF